MTELTNIHNTLFELYEQLSEWEQQHQYMTKHHIINDELIHQVIVSVNHCSFQIRESIYPIIHRVVLVDAPVIKLAKSLVKDIQELEYRLLLLESADSSIQQAAYLFILTLETSSLLNKSKLMLRKEEASRNHGITTVIPKIRARVAV